MLSLWTRSPNSEIMTNEQIKKEIWDWEGLVSTAQNIHILSAVVLFLHELCALFIIQRTDAQQSRSVVKGLHLKISFSPLLLSFTSFPFHDQLVETLSKFISLPNMELCTRLDINYTPFHAQTCHKKTLKRCQWQQNGSYITVYKCKNWQNTSTAQFPTANLY